MAGNSEDHNILDAVHKQIENFPSDSEADVSSHRLNVTPPGMSGKEYERQVRELEQEIEDLQNQLLLQDKQANVTPQDLDEVMQLLKNQGSEDDEDTETANDVQKDIDRLEKVIKLNGSVTGVDLTDTSYRILSTDGGEIKKENILSGSCHDVDFKLNVYITEKQGPDIGNDRKASITDMEIFVGEEVLDTLQSTLERIIEAKSVEMFFMVLPPAAQLVRGRIDVFMVLKEQYPDMVHLPHGLYGPTITFRDTNKCNWNILWEIVISEDLNVTQKLKLEVVAPSEGTVQKKDRKAVLKSAPGMFDKMVDNMGPAEALESLIKACQNT